MRNTIGKKIIVIMLTSSVLILGLLSAFTAYCALWLAEVWTGLGPTPFFMLLGAAAAASLTFMMLMIAYVKRKISGPLKSLMLAADAISNGDTEAEIPSFPDSDNEIGALSRSLYRMAEQFRIYILRMEQAREEERIFLKLDALMAAGDTAQVMKGLSAMLCEQFLIDRSSAVCLYEGSAHVLSRYANGAEQIGAESPPDFLYHTKIMPLLEGKKILLMNAYIISEQKTDFLDEETRFACVLPLREEHHVLGYMILESKRDKDPFAPKDELILLRIAEALAGFIKNNKDKLKPPEPSAPEQQESPQSGPLDDIWDVEGLDSASAIETMGGMSDLYEQALKLLMSLLPETVEKLDDCLASDINAFAIEIHGLKGSLNNVGAYGMGMEASRIEKAAKSGDGALCAESYGAFRDELTKFHQRLVRALERGYGKSPGNIRELVAVLPEAEAAAADCDCHAALEALDKMDGFSFDRETDVSLGNIRVMLEAFEAEIALEDIKSLKERLAHWEEV